MSVCKIVILLASVFPVCSKAISAPGVIVGIDLGTTTSAIAIIKEGLPIIIRDADGKVSMPSCIALSRDGGLTAGVDTDGIAIRSSKRVIGLTAEAARERLAGAT